MAHFWPMGESSGSSFADMRGWRQRDTHGRCDAGQSGRPGRRLLDLRRVRRLLGRGPRRSRTCRARSKLTVEFWMKWKSYGADDHLALEFTPNFNEHPGGFLVDPDATPGSDFAVVDRRGRLAQHGLLRTAERGSVALLRVRDQHRSVRRKRRSRRTWTVSGRLHARPNRVQARATSPTRRCTGCRATQAACSAPGRCRISRSMKTTLARARFSNTTSTVRTPTFLANTTAPSIEGTAKDGQTLTANPVCGLGARRSSYAYQWQSCNCDGRRLRRHRRRHRTGLVLIILATWKRSCVSASRRPIREVRSPEPRRRAPRSNRGRLIELEAPSIRAPLSRRNAARRRGFVGRHRDGSRLPVGKVQLGVRRMCGYHRCDRVGIQARRSRIGSTVRLRVGASNELGSLTASFAAEAEEIALPHAREQLGAKHLGYAPEGQTLTAKAGSWLGKGHLLRVQWQSCDRMAPAVKISRRDRVELHAGQRQHRARSAGAGERDRNRRYGVPDLVHNATDNGCDGSCARNVADCDRDGTGRRYPSGVERHVGPGKNR